MTLDEALLLAVVEAFTFLEDWGPEEVDPDSAIRTMVGGVLRPE
jgi:hypothetical protein